MNAQLSANKRRKTWILMKRHKDIYLMLLPVILFYILFHYVPMGGLVIAFQNYKPRKGLLGSDWVGLQNFEKFLTGMYAGRVIKNTLGINFLQLLFGFPAPIILALLINEMNDNCYKKSIQTVSYMPHFISLVVVCGMIRDFSMTDGLFNEILSLFGVERMNLLSSNKTYRSVYVLSGIWKNIGWGSIVYLSALSSVDASLHEAAALDGAGKLRRIWHVNLPAIVPIIIIQLIMRLGNMMSEGHEKTLLLYSSVVYESADLISSYVYRYGLEKMQYSYGAAVDVFNSIVNLIFLVSANRISAKVTETSLW